MPVERYRIKEPTIAMAQEDGRGVAHTVGVGTIIEVQNGPLDGDKLVEVTWKSRTVLMFTQDLRLRAEQLE